MDQSPYGIRVGNLLPLFALAFACAPSQPSPAPPRTPTLTPTPPQPDAGSGSENAECNGVREEPGGKCIPVLADKQQLTCIGRPGESSNNPLQFAVFETDFEGKSRRPSPQDDDLCHCMESHAFYVPPARGASVTFRIAPDGAVPTFTRDPTIPDLFVGCIAASARCSPLSATGCAIEFHLTASDFAWLEPDAGDVWRVGLRIVGAASPLNRAMAYKLAARALPMYRKCLSDGARLPNAFYVGGRFTIGRDLSVVHVQADRDLHPWAGGCCASWAMTAPPEGVEQCVVRAHYALELGSIGNQDGLPAEIAFSLAFRTETPQPTSTPK